MDMLWMAAAETVEGLVSLDIANTVLKIVIGCGLGLLISLSYIASARKSFSRHFAVMLVVLPALVGVVILMVGTNVARAFSIAGIFSLVRFRSIPGDSKDIMTVFFAMAVGLAVGLGFYPEALVMTLVVGVIIAAVSVSLMVKTNKNERQLRISIPENLNFEQVFDDIFEKYLKEVNLQQVKTANMGTLFELTYLVVMKPDVNYKEFMDELRTRNGNLNIMLSMVPEEKGNTTVL